LIVHEAEAGTQWSFNIKTRLIRPFRQAEGALWNVEILAIN
jgi:hypothetical protein